MVKIGSYFSNWYLRDIESFCWTNPEFGSCRVKSTDVLSNAQFILSVGITRFLTLSGSMVFVHAPGKHLQNGQWRTCTPSLGSFSSAPFPIISLTWLVMPHWGNTWNFSLASMALLFFFNAFLQQRASYRSRHGCWMKGLCCHPEAVLAHRVTCGCAVVDFGFILRALPASCTREAFLEFFLCYS